MEHTYVVDVDRITLEPLQINDIEALRNLRNQERKWFLNDGLIKEEQQKEWYKKYLLQNNDIMFKIIYKKKPNVFSGAIAVYNINFEKKICEIGRTLVDKNIVIEKGIGQEATKAVSLFALKQLEMETVRAHILKSNERSLKIHLRAGFYKIEDYNLDTYTVELTRQSIQNLPNLLCQLNSNSYVDILS